MLFKFSKVTIQTNGYFTDFFPISRSVKQGCPIAPLLYILQAEPMACKIRKNPNIEGIELPLIDNTPRRAKVLQYVDDTQFFPKNENSVPFIMEDLTLYGKASGAKTNNEKTKGLLIGKNKNKNPTCNLISWTRNYVKTLGIRHGYNIEIDDFWRNKINKLKSCIQVWKSRNLSIFGRVLIVKTFIFSSINFELETNGIPDKFSSEIDKIILDFIWSNKKHLVSTDKLKYNKLYGGLNLYSVKDLVRAQRIKMLYKIIHSDTCEWNVIGKYNLRVIDSDFETSYLLCSFSNMEFITLNRRIPIFYFESLCYWNSFMKTFIPETKNQVLNCNIFGNAMIKFRRRPLFSNPLSKAIS